MNTKMQVSGGNYLTGHSKQGAGELTQTVSLRKNFVECALCFQRVWMLRFCFDFLNVCVVCVFSFVYFNDVQHEHTLVHPLSIASAFKTSYVWIVVPFMR